MSDFLLEFDQNSDIQQAFGGHGFLQGQHASLIGAILVGAVTLTIGMTMLCRPATKKPVEKP